MSNAVRCALILALAASPGVFGGQAGKSPVKVFILAGQSNMEGQGVIAAGLNRNEGKGSLEYLVKNPATAPRFKHLVDKSGQWVVRDEVWIWYLDRKGGLTVGYGPRDDKIGPELQFGHIMGDAFANQVLLIKLAWGGKSLAKDFRPPSSGGEVGPYYRQLVERTKEVLANLKTLFPDYDGKGYELAGIGWHQGWNDRINQAFVDEYETNLIHLIRDVRKDLKAPNLPFVVAESGMTGPNESNSRALKLMGAQAAATRRSEWKGSVGFVKTRYFWREEADSPTNQGYHWNSNAETYWLIGEAMGREMLKVMPKAQP